MPIVKSEIMYMYNFEWFCCCKDVKFNLMFTMFKVGLLNEKLNNNLLQYAYNFGDGCNSIYLSYYVRFHRGRDGWSYLPANFLLGLSCGLQLDFDDWFWILIADLYIGYFQYFAQHFTEFVLFEIKLRLKFL